LKYKIINKNQKNLYLNKMLFFAFFISFFTQLIKKIT